MILPAAENMQKNGWKTESHEADSQKERSVLKTENQELKNALEGTQRKRA